MGTDFHAPLGQNRPPPKPKRSIFTTARLLSFVAVVAVIGLSLYALQGEEALKQVASSGPAKPQPEAAPATPSRHRAEQQQPGSMPLSNPNLGANIERTQTDDGSVVTKYSPRARDGSGPVLIDAQRIGQDPRVAAQPNEALLEDTPQGRLPIIGPDGLRPMDQYARPWSGARGTRIAIVVSGLGLSQTGTQHAIRELPASVTLAFAASGNSLQRWMQEARRSGHEILVQLPLEPFDYPANDPGPDTLLVKSSPKENLNRLHNAMGRITNYTGIMNYQGARFLSDANALEPVLRDISKRGLLFLDDGTSAQSRTEVISKAIQLPHAFADLTLDGQLQTEAILKKLDELERIAGRKGSAIGVASAFNESVAAIRKWSDEASQRGIELVGISALAGESIER